MCFPLTTSVTPEVICPNLLHDLFEGFIDGILLASPCGKLVYANDRGWTFCQKVSEKSDRLPKQLWQMGQQLLVGDSTSPFLLDHRILPDTRVRVQRWPWRDRAFLLFIWEDYQQTLQQQAIADRQKYQFTNREAEVWQLRQQQLSYPEIAAKLYISVNTVKKHLKNINAKRQAVLWAENDI
ncbi:MAG: helix-turn-helix transcriptional regulator [Spirulinaceae cyanobacterium]